MNDRNIMDFDNGNGACDVSMECKTNVSGVSATNRSPVADTHAMCLLKGIGYVFSILLFIMVISWIFASCGMKANATENSVYVDSEYMQEQFGAYKNYAIVTDGQGNYATIYSDGQIISTGTTIHSLLTNGYYGFKTMKLENDYLVIDENGKSYNNWSSVTVQLNSLSIGYTSSINQFVWSNVDIYKTVFSNTGSPSATDEVLYSVANNIGSKPIEEPTEPTPSITVDCKFTDENIVEKLETMNKSIELLSETVTQKLDLILTLLIIFMALKMFSPLANNYKRGLQKKEK